MTADTLVRPASISKLFTAIAALQLVRQGKLDLDRDVNEYLDFHIPTPRGGLPVTLRLLLTHRAGFEDHLKELFQAAGLPARAAVWLRRNLPQRLFVHDAYRRTRTTVTLWPVTWSSGRAGSGSKITPLTTFSARSIWSGRPSKSRRPNHWRNP
jgi:CubicO group peptidase (beta-lactamase class C family)